MSTEALTDEEIRDLQVRLNRARAQRAADSRWRGKTAEELQQHQRMAIECRWTRQAFVREHGREPSDEEWLVLKRAIQAKHAPRRRRRA